MSDIEILDNPAVSHWEARVDGEVAGFAQYELDGDTVTYLHTEVDPRFGGHGIGTKLIQASLHHARQEGWKVVPRCPFYAKYFREHPEVADLRA